MGINLYLANPTTFALTGMFMRSDGSYSSLIGFCGAINPHEGGKIPRSNANEAADIEGNYLAYFRKQFYYSYYRSELYLKLAILHGNEGFYL